MENERSPEEWQELSNWLLDFLVDHAGEPFAFGGLLGRGAGDDPPYPTDFSQQDRLELFEEVVRNLTTILGSEQAAADWLFHDEHFRKTGGYVPFDYLETGDFDALALLHALTEIEVRYGQAELGQSSKSAPLSKRFLRRPETPKEC